MKADGGLACVLVPALSAGSVFKMRRLVFPRGFHADAGYKSQQQ